MIHVAPRSTPPPPFRPCAGTLRADRGFFSEHNVTAWPARRRQDHNAFRQRCGRRRSPQRGLRTNRRRSKQGNAFSPVGRLIHSALLFEYLKTVRSVFRNLSTGRPFSLKGGSDLSLDRSAARSGEFSRHELLAGHNSGLDEVGLRTDDAGHQLCNRVTECHHTRRFVAEGS